MTPLVSLGGFRSPGVVVFILWPRHGRPDTMTSGSSTVQVLGWSLDSEKQTNDAEHGGKEEIS